MLANVGVLIYLLSNFVSACDERVHSYDFVVVGAGTAGSAIASRLSESGDHAVLLIEEGGRANDQFMNVPALALQQLGKSNLRKTYYSDTTQPGTLTNRTIQFMTGRVLGGSSSINGMVINRGSRHDFDNWAKLTGDNSWKYENMLKYFKKSESYERSYPSDQYGYNGPITVSRPKYAPGLDNWLEAGRELGYSVMDPNGPQKISFTPIEFSRRFGRRVSSYSGYMKNIKKNLKIIINTEASKIVRIFDGKRAVGLKYMTNSSQGILHGFAWAHKEIIICAGVIGSPILLMKSGIGPKSVLHTAKIPQISNLPVGRNLHDHILITVGFVINDNSSVFISTRDLTPTSWDLYTKLGEGPYTSYNGITGQAFIASPHAATDNDWADTHLIFASSPDLASVSIPGYSENINISSGEVIVMAYVVATRPVSRGVLALNPKNPRSPPSINWKLNAHSKDLDVILNGIKTLLQIFESTSTFQKLGGHLYPNPLEACKKHKFRSDEYWKCYILHTYSPGFHAGGTCRMGNALDLNAVVDSNLRVLGLVGLRVVDASIMPSITNANLQAPVYAIAEKVANKILQEWPSVT